METLLNLTVASNGMGQTTVKARPKSIISTLEPFSPSGRQTCQSGEKSGKNVKILHLVDISLECNYESIYLCKYQYIWLNT